MNKLFLFLAFALVACSDDPPASHSELCAKNSNSKECLAGRWYLEDIEGGNRNCKPNDGYLTLQANGEFFFRGSYNVYNSTDTTKGYWNLNETGKKMNIECKIDCRNANAPREIEADIEIINNGAKLRLTTSGYTAFLQCSIGINSTEFTEIFSRQGD
jgi:hypothetical protein